MSHYKNNCVFCKVAQRKIEHSQFWEDKSHIAFLSREPQAFGHTLVIPKNHNSYVFNLHKKEYLKLLLASEKVAKALKKVTRCKRIVLAIYGFEVPHTHVHLIPMNSLADTKHKIRKPSREKINKFIHKIEELID